MQQLDFVSKRQANWKIIVGQNLLQILSRLIDLSAYSKIGIITDKNVARLHLKSLIKSLSGAVNKPLVITLPAGEKAKSLDEAEKIYRILLDENFDRQSVLFAFGGGVVGDLTGFIAATYIRGIDFVQIPTTLLAQVDASIGGKTGVNFKGLKNMIGAFYQPRAIVSDVSLLRTLPQKELRSGLAEAVKYGLIKDKEIFNMLEMKGAKLSESQLQEVVIRSSKIKGKIVEEDEQEKKGIRELLNFGHTLGHAVESVGEGKYTHGEAISIGMRFALEASYLVKMINKNEYDKIVETLTKLSLPVTCALSREKLLEKIAYDKKSVNKQTRWVLLKGVGTAVPGQTISNTVIYMALKEVVI